MGIRTRDLGWYRQYIVSQQLSFLLIFISISFCAIDRSVLKDEHEKVIESWVKKSTNTPYSYFVFINTSLLRESRYLDTRSYT